MRGTEWRGKKTLVMDDGKCSVRRRATKTFLFKKTRESLSSNAKCSLVMM